VWDRHWCQGADDRLAELLPTPAAEPPDPPLPVDAGDRGADTGETRLVRSLLPRAAGLMD
jgi:hypothetical protein